MGFPISALRMRNAAASAPGPYGSHVGWRIYIDEGDTSDGSTDATNIELRETSGGANIAASGTAFVGGAGAAVTFTIPADAFTGSIYRRDTDAGWYIGVLFASAKGISELVLGGASARGRCIIKARLQYSDNTTTGSDGTWTDAFSIYDPVMTLSSPHIWPQDLTGASGYKAYRFKWTATPTAARSILAELEMIKSTVDYTSSAKVIYNFGTAPTSYLDGSVLCDNNLGTQVASVTLSSGVVIMSMATPILIDSYSVSSGNNAARAPRDWTVDGSNDGTWTNLDTVTGETFATTLLTKTYTI